MTESPARHVLDTSSNDIPGCADLGETGVWSTNATYGIVWYPPLPDPSWSPYRHGHWVWVDPWGWTWIPDEPWGYAPFHYGRWIFIGVRWGWVPGPIMRRPCYAPALVAFVGGGGISVGVEAWFPLGPSDPFIPWYHHSPGYLIYANQTNVRNVTDFNAFVHPVQYAPTHYANFGRGVTAVPSVVLSGGRPVAQSVLRVLPEQLAHAAIAPHPNTQPTIGAVVGRPTPRPSTGVGVPPTRGTIGGRGAPPVGAKPPATSGRGKAPTKPPTNPPTKPPANAPAKPPTNPPARGRGRGGQSPLVVRVQPPAPEPPFAARVRAMAADPGRPLEPEQKRNLQAGKPAGLPRDPETPAHPRGRGPSVH
jgi:hypothetical protein